VSASTVDPPTSPRGQGIPRWPARIALLLVGGLLLLVSNQLTVGPSWLPLAISVVLVVLLVVAESIGRHDIKRRIGLLAIAVLTAAVIASTIYLVLRLLDNSLPASTMLQGAGVIWVANIGTFAIWYWEVDGGGPDERRLDAHVSTDFAFPQMTLAQGSPLGWAPGFFDYLFLAFNTSTAFSPTDTLVLSRRAKALMMVQASISLLTIAVLVGRAINTLR
jgi:hypothetical protein